jgi:hypothetical protein
MLVVSRGVTLSADPILQIRAWITVGVVKFYVVFVFCVFLSVKLRAFVLCVSFFYVFLAIRLRSMLTVFFIFPDAGRG